MEVLFEDPGRRRVVKVVRAQRIDDDAEPLLHILKIQSRQHKALVADDLRGRIADDLVIDLAVSLCLRHIEFARRHVGYSDPAPALLAVENAEDKVILPLLDGIHIEVGAGRDNADHFPLHHALGCPGVLYLLADRGLISLFHKTRQVAVDGMERHAAHRRPLRQAAALPGQSQFQLPRYDLGVLKEHLIEISETVKEDTARILFFGLEVMLHHGAEFG